MLPTVAARPRVATGPSARQTATSSTVHSVTCTAPGTQNRFPKTRIAALTGRMSVGPVVTCASKRTSAKSGWSKPRLVE